MGAVLTGCPRRHQWLMVDRRRFHIDTRSIAWELSLF